MPLTIKQLCFGLHLPERRLLPQAFLLMLLLARPTAQLELNCSGGHLPTVGPGVKQITLEAIGPAGEASPTVCHLRVTAALDAGRWYLKLESGSGADGDLIVRHGAETSAWNGASQLSSEVLARLFTLTGDFSLDLSLRAGRLTLRASLIAPSACPPESDGWSMPWPGGCLLVSMAPSNSLSFADAQRACERVGANLFTTAASDPTAWALSYLYFGNRLRTGFAYWIGGRLTKDGDWAYINGSRLLTGSTLPPYKYDCGQSRDACQCALYRAAQLYRNYCSDRRPYICSAPPGGAPTFYSVFGTACIDCRPAEVTVSTADNVGQAEHQVYFYVLGICVCILGAITASVLGCFVHSVRRWRLDAKLAATRPPDYDNLPGDGPAAFAMRPGPASEPPSYEYCTGDRAQGAAGESAAVVSA